LVEPLRARREFAIGFAGENRHATHSTVTT
jgi:hypothetical protein